MLNYLAQVARDITKDVEKPMLVECASDETKRWAMNGPAEWEKIKKKKLGQGITKDVKWPFLVEGSRKEGRGGVAIRATKWEKAKMRNDSTIRKQCAQLKC